ncbi:MAG: hypothetical protein KDD40_10090, partial [Bdellovibrionales bacterium]|nr:hypothetical protein [Bdellovibrionales bacterium]
MLFTLYMFLSTFSHARNSSIAAMYNQWVNKNKACFDLPMEELEASGYNCSMGNPTGKVIATKWEIFEWSIFQKATENQILKNECLEQQLNVMINDDKKLEDWSFYVAVAWIGYKQSQLLNAYCIRRIEDENNFESFYIPKPEHKILGNCDQNRVDELSSAQQLFPLAIPVIGSHTFMEVIESHRQHITKDNQPLSDEQLSRLDLNNLESVTVDVVNELKTTLRKRLSQLKKERSNINQELKASKNSSGHYQLNEDQQDFIYNEGTVQETLSELGFYNSQGANCMTANFEPTTSGSMFELAVTSIGGGGAWGALFRGARWLAGLSKLKQAGKMLNAGLMMGTANMIGHEIANQCPLPFSDRKLYLLKKLEKNRSAWDDITFKDEDVPACKKLANQNFAYNDFYNTNCALTVLLSLMP